MTVSWERFAGSTDLFAVRLSFLPDPDRNIAADVDEAISWGALQVWVDGQNLCSHVDQGEVLQGVHWYLLPFLEWLADVWDPLLHEERLPNRNSGNSATQSLAVTRVAPFMVTESDTFAWEEEWYDWRLRHAIRAARSGGLFPNIVVCRLRDLIEISWSDEPLPGAPQGFHFSAASGVTVLPPDVVAGPLYQVAVAATSHLLSVNPASDRLARLARRIESLGS